MSEFKKKMQAHERSVLEEALVRNRGNRSHTAKELGITRRSLIYKIARYKIDVPSQYNARHTHAYVEFFAEDWLQP